MDWTAKTRKSEYKWEVDVTKKKTKTNAHELCIALSKYYRKGKAGEFRLYKNTRMEPATHGIDRL